MLKQLFLSKTQAEQSGDIIDILRLIRSENVGPKTFFALIKCFGSASVALENLGEFSVRGGRTRPIKVGSIDEAHKELEALHKHGSALITYNSPQFSQLLKQISDPPPVLSYKGNILLLQESLPIAIVGARNASAHGQVFAEKLSNDLVKNHCTIVSGMARGIDTAAHRTVTSSTIAVLAGGIDYIYPPENHKLYNSIAEEGLIVAELPISTKPLGQHFPQRNRIISGLSLATVIIEATIKSGSLITARFALEQNREVFATPGFPLDPRSQGTNKLIKEGANLIESADDVLTNVRPYNILDKDFDDINDTEISKRNFQLTNHNIHKINDKMRKTIVDLLSSVPLEFDAIVKSSNLPLPIIHLILLELELAGRITRCSGDKFCLTYSTSS